MGGYISKGLAKKTIIHDSASNNDIHGNKTTEEGNQQYEQFKFQVK